ncbi:MAG: hypothetical protein ACYC3S_04125 [Chloroflexota bacterium]
MEIIVLAVIGIIVGVLVDTLTPGRILFGWLLAALLGVAGAAAGGLMFGYLDPLQFAIGTLPVLPALVGALILVLILEVPLAIFRRPRS